MAAADPSADFKANFAKFADKGNAMTSKALTKWFKDTGAFNKKVTSQSLDICFSKHKTKGQNSVTAAQAFTIATEMDGQSKGVLAKLSATGAEKDLKSGTTKQSKTGNVDGMTDTSKYTGSHKERFDKDGKGKGIEGRADRADNTGYVGDYKGKDTYDKTH